MNTIEYTTSAQQAANVFERKFGYKPAGVWSAPGRVNIIGEHVDYAGGLCLPFAINRRTYCAAAPRTDGVICIHSLLPQYGKTSTWKGKLKGVGPGAPKSWPAYPAGVVWCMWQDAPAMGLKLNDQSGLDMLFLSDVPLGAGLSSSAAIELATACAVFDLYGPTLASLPNDRLGRSSNRIIAACIRAENEIVGASTGGLDQTASFYGKVGHVLELDMGKGTLELMPFDLSRNDLAILIIDTNAPHNLGDGQYGSRRAIVNRVMEGLGTAIPHREENLVERAMAWSEGEPESQDTEDVKNKWIQMVERRMRHIVSESRRTQSLVNALKSGVFETTDKSTSVDGLRQIGNLMVASHESLRDDYEVSCPELDSAVEAALQAGAWGARMTGGGFGGSAIALINTVDIGKVEKAVLDSAKRRKFATPNFLVAVPSDGAGCDI